MYLGVRTLSARETPIKQHANTQPPLDHGVAQRCGVGPLNLALSDASTPPADSSQTARQFLAPMPHQPPAAPESPVVSDRPARQRPRQDSEIALYNHSAP